MPLFPRNEVIGDNYASAKNRLKKLTEYFYKSKDVLYEYDIKKKKKIENAPEYI